MEELKHFSHNHGLVFHQVPQGSQINCSGCKSPGSGNVFVCWQCNYFLHEQCFSAARSLKHPSHPLHPLTLVPFPTYPSGSFFCNYCNLGGDGFSYSCCACEFDIHVHCALTPNPNPHVFPSPVPAPNFSAQNPYSQPQYPIYPPPMQTGAFPTYPSDHSAITPNTTQNYPPQPQTTSYPPVPNSPYPNSSPAYPPNHQSPSPAYPQPNAIPQTFVPQVNATTTTNPPPPTQPNPTVPAYSPVVNAITTTNPPPPTQPNPTVPTYSPVVNAIITTNPLPPTQHNPTVPTYSPVVNAATTTNPPPLPQPNSTMPTYSNVVNATATTNPPPLPQPNPTVPTYSTVVNDTAATTPPTQPTLVQTSNPQPKPSSIIKHFSHSHVLKQMEIEQKKSKICSACECELSGSAYCCTEPHCTFNLHKTCFDSPREVRHKSHLQHPLTLLTAPPYEDGFTCNACLKDGKAFAYNCATCAYDLHIDCIQWPDTVTRSDHKHSLTLYYSNPAAEASQEATFVCDVCKNPVHEMAWLYYCRECDFGTHLECVASAIKQQNVGGDKTQEELMRETELKFAMLQLLLGAQGGNVPLELIR